MRFDSISYQPSANVQFTKRELQLMAECSRLHYDWVCKSIREQGGFLYGWQQANALVRKPKDRTERVSTRQLDTLMKVMEMARHLRKLKDQQEAFGIGLKLKRIWVVLSDNLLDRKPGIKL